MDWVCVCGECVRAHILIKRPQTATPGHYKQNTSERFCKTEMKSNIGSGWVCVVWCVCVPTSHWNCSGGIHVFRSVESGHEEAFALGIQCLHENSLEKPNDVPHTICFFMCLLNTHASTNAIRAKVGHIGRAGSMPDKMDRHTTTGKYFFHCAAVISNVK